MEINLNKLVLPKDFSNLWGYLINKYGWELLCLDITINLVHIVYSEDIHMSSK